MQWFCYLVDDVTVEWTLRHGRSAALFVALKEAPEKVYVPEYKDKIHKVILSFIAADRVRMIFLFVSRYLYWLASTKYVNTVVFTSNRNIWFGPICRFP